MAELLGLFRLAVDQEPKAHGPHDTHQPVCRVQARCKIRKGHADGLHDPQQFLAEARTSGQTVGRPHFQVGPADEQIRDIGKYIFAELSVPMHRLLFQLPLGLFPRLFLGPVELFADRGAPGLGPVQLLAGILSKTARDGVGLICLEQ